MIACIHCGAEVWWGMPRPDDPCYECKRPIAVRVDDCGMCGLDEIPGPRPRVAWLRLRGNLDKARLLDTGGETLPPYAEADVQLAGCTYGRRTR